MTAKTSCRCCMRLLLCLHSQPVAKPYVVPLRDNKDIHYASKDTLMRSVYEKYSPDKKGEEEIPPGSYSVEQILGEKNYPESEKNARHGGRAVLHSEQKKNPEKQI